MKQQKIELLAGTLVKPKGDNPNTSNSISAQSYLNMLECPTIRANGVAYGFTVGGKISPLPPQCTRTTLSNRPI